MTLSSFVTLQNPIIAHDPSDTAVCCLTRLFVGFWHMCALARQELVMSVIRLRAFAKACPGLINLPYHEQQDQLRLWMGDLTSSMFEFVNSVGDLLFLSVLENESQLLFWALLLVLMLNFIGRMCVHHIAARMFPECSCCARKAVQSPNSCFA